VAGTNYTDSITVTSADGTASQVITVTIAGTNDGPVLDLDASGAGTGFATAFNAGTGNPVSIGDVDLSILDPDSNIVSATITITTGKDLADVLVAGSMPVGIMASSYNSTTGVLTLNGSASVASYEAAIRAIYFDSTNLTNATQRSITVVVNDGVVDSNVATTTVSILGATAGVPVLDLDANDSSGATITAYQGKFTVGAGTVAIADTDVLINDSNSTNMTGATITLTNFKANDVLAAGTLPAGITASAYNAATGVITLSGSATIASYQDAIRAITFNTSSTDMTARTINVRVTDGTNNSNTAVSTISMNRAPTLDLDGNNSTTTGSDYITTYTDGGGAVAVADIDISVADLDGTLMSASITITNPKAGDVLTVGTLPTGIMATVSGNTVLLSGAATPADYQTAIRAVSFSNSTGTPDTTPRTIAVTVNDGAVTSNTATATINVVDVNSAPVLDLDASSAGTGFATFYSVVTRPNVAIGDSDVSITDLDSTNITGATITLTNMKAGDVLIAGTMPLGITASVVGNVVTLSGAAFITDYQAAIRAISFNSTSSDLTARNISVTVTDGSSSSNTANTTITIIAANNPPVADVIVTSGNEDTLIPVTLHGTDSDGTVTNFSLSTLPSNGLLYLDAAMTQLAPTGMLLSASSGSLTLYFKPQLDWNGTVNFNYTASDNVGGVSSAAMATVTVTPVNDGAPLAVADSYSTTLGNPIIISKASLLANDTLFDNATITGFTVPTGGTLVDNGTYYTYTPPATAGTRTFTYTLTDQDGQASTATVSVGVFGSGDDLATVQESAVIGGAGTNVVTGNLFTNDTGNTSVTSITLTSTNTASGTANTISNTTVGNIITVVSAIGTLEVDKTTGDYIYTLNNAANNSASNASVDEVFSYVGNNSSAALRVTVQDDLPAATNITVEIPEQVLPKFNLVVVLDLSGSMSDQVQSVAADGTVTLTTRLAVAKSAIVALINEYYSQASDVSVKIVTFSTTATILNGNAPYASKESAIAAVNALTATGNTNYEDALIKTQTALGATLDPTRSNNVYFLSDGDPTTSVTTAGLTAPVTASGYATYLNLHPEVKSYGVAVGSGVSNLTHLDQINNVDALGDGVRDPAIVVADVNKLEETLISTVPAAYGGNVISTSSIGASGVTFGADGGYISQLSVMLDTDNNPATAEVSVAFSYDKVANQISWTGGSPAGSPLAGNLLSLDTSKGFTHGTLVFDFKTGDYTYFTAGTAHQGDGFTLNYTAIDADGDVASATQTISIVDGKPVANNDSDTLSDLSKFLEGNVISGVGTDGGVGVGSQLTSFTPQASGVDNPQDNAQVSSIVFKGMTYNLTVNSSGTSSGGSYVISGGSLTWTHASNGSKLIFGENGYYKYTPPTADLPTENPAAVSTITLTSAANASAGGLTLQGLTSLNTPAATVNTTTAFTSAPAAATGVVLSGIDANGIATYTQAQLAYNSTRGVGLNSASTTADNANDFDRSETLVVTFNSVKFPDGVNNPSFAIRVDTAGQLTYRVFDTSGTLLGQVTQAATATLNLSGYANVGSVQIQPTTAQIRVTNVTYADAAQPTVAYNASGVSVGAAATGGISNLETLVIDFNRATHPQGVEKLRFNITNGGTAEAVTYTFYHIDGHELGQYTVAGTGWITMPVQYSSIGRVTALADTGTSVNILNVEYKDVVNSPSAAAVAPEVIQYTLTDTDGDSSSASLTLNITTNTFAGDTAANTINGTAANDEINGLGGDDTLNGMAGNDIIQGGDGNDIIDGGADNDILSGGAGNDTIIGGTGNDILRGNDGDDSLSGGDGADLLEGGAGTDTLSGGIGDDTIAGGAGSDFLTGGSGSDVFEWTLADAGVKGVPAVDTVTDFSPLAKASGGDVLDLRDLLSSENHDVGTGNLANYLHFELVGADTKVHISSNGGFSAGYAPNQENQTIVLQGVDLTAGFSNDQQIIQDMLNKGKLITD